MIKKNYKGRCIKKSVEKSKEVCKIYNDIQLAYLDILHSKDDVIDIQCNVSLVGDETEEYCTDFLCRKLNGNLMVRECVFRKTRVLKNIFKASPCELYSLSAIVGILFLITRYAIRLISTVKPQKYACIAGGRFSPYISAVLKPSTMIAAGFKKHICFRIGLSKSTFQKTGVTQNPS